jgi:hypothetical protein
MTLTRVPDAVPNFTALTWLNPDPRTVIRIPPLILPFAGDNDVTAGRATRELSPVCVAA